VESKDKSASGSPDEQAAGLQARLEHSLPQYGVVSESGEPIGQRAKCPTKLLRQLGSSQLVSRPWPLNV
jgi:hypothetical protein